MRSALRKGFSSVPGSTVFHPIQNLSLAALGHGEGQGHVPVEQPVDEGQFTLRLAEHIRVQRQSRGWTLDQLSDRSQISRATLSRIEKGEVSPTAEVLGRLSAAYGLTPSRLLLGVEERLSPLVVRDAQFVWRDKASSFTRRQVSPPARGLSAEVLECHLQPGAHIAYDAPPVHGLEHHLIMLEGALCVTLSGQDYDLHAGDCLRFLMRGPISFQTGLDAPARYHAVVVSNV